MTTATATAKPSAKKSAKTSGGISNRNADPRLGIGLGWFSIGLGLAQIFAPRSMARMLGVPERSTALRLVGIRELAAGVGLLAQPTAPAWRWARVAGDIMDLALLGGSAARDGVESEKLARTTAATLGITAVDVAAGLESRRGQSGGKARKEGPSRAVITVNRSPEECYNSWLDLNLVAKVCIGVQSIRASGENRSRWRMQGMDGDVIEWESEYIEKEPNRRLVWRSVPGSSFKTEGRVTFDPAPGGRGTIVRFETAKHNGGGRPGRLFGRVKAQRNLLRFKQLLETGTIPTTEGQPSGPRSPAAKLLQKGEQG